MAHFLLSWFWNIKGLSQTSDSAKTVTMAGISRATHASTDADADANADTDADEAGS